MYCVQVFFAYFSLIRVHNCFVALLAVAVGQYLTPALFDARVNPFAMAAAFFVCGFGNIINDIVDIEADRVNHPGRALPSGAITIARARTMAFFFLTISLLLMFKLNGISCLIVVLSVLLVLWYNTRLKHTSYWGNLAVSILGGFAFLLGGAAGGWGAMISLPGPIIPAAFAILMHFGREIIKDLEDRAGDAMTGSGTAAVKSETSWILSVAGIVFLILIFASLWVYLNGWFGPIYFYILLSSIHIPLSVLFLWLAANPESKRCRVVSAVLKLQMIFGLGALVLGRNY
jgi:geranylgeranylglycerol-phosphate geranylgeranyltransferase